MGDPERMGYPRQVTSIYDLARSAGVAPSTVSKALRDDRRISEATRARIQTLAAEAGFTPNSAAQSLTTRRTMTLGLIIRDYADPYNGLLMRGIESAALRAGYQLLVASTHGAESGEVDIARLFRQRRVDGMVIVASHLDEEHARLDPGVPLVFIAEKPELLPERPLVGLVAVDDAAGGRTLTDHLIGLGHRRIGYVAIGRASISSADRQYGYQAALQAAGLALDPRLIVTPSRRDPAGAGAEGVELLLPQRPTAIFFYNDLAAIGGLRALLDRGIRVPEAISIVGFDDLEVSALVTPPLTTMAQPRLEMGRIATEQLLRMIRGEVDDVRVDAGCTLVVRRSTAPPPVASG
jgi:DNA-binding LacI/PurR family transcriptional regulator